MNPKTGSLVLILFITVTVISGCATVRSNRTPKVDPKVRVQQLEEELKQRDAEIMAMRDEMAQGASGYSSTASSDYGSFSSKSSGLVSPSLSVSVKSVQKALKSAGFYTGAIDGKGGPKTKEALKAFQRARGLKSDGVVGKKTWTALNRYLN
mgnify:CR=1 FL=1